jgi:dTMP kinase
VVCDRFTDATYAYQGGGRGIPNPRIAAIEEWMQDNRRPDITLLLDADVETALSRIKARQAGDRFEREPLDFFVRVRRAYLELAAREPQRFCIVDATGAVDEVGCRITDVCKRLILTE